MTEPLATGTTNDEVGSTVDVEADCGILWSAAHQFAYLRLSESPVDEETFEVDLLDSYYARARRIAATYARFYLEQDEGSDFDKKGRYYWLAFGAFASKTVACFLDSWQIKGSFLGGLVADWTLDDENELNLLSEGLAMGNLWLFMDVIGWHWFYSNYQEQFFEGMACAEKRDVQKLADIPKEVVTENLQWADYALSKINNLKPTTYIIDAMKLVEEIENESEINERAGLQLDHLKAVANHEQEMILQKLLYTHPGFEAWLKRERNWRRYKLVDKIMPVYQLVLTSGCETDKEAFKSIAPEGVELETLGSLNDGTESKTRMGWIGDAAKTFHFLMQNHTQQMEVELSTIAGWVDEQDGPDIWLHPSSFK